MKNKKLAVIGAYITAAALLAAPAHAANEKSVVIIDSGVDTSGFLKSYIIDEACFIEYGKCPNGTAQMTGPGSANVVPTSTTDRVFSHGSQMSSVVIAKNPAVKIVPVRIVGMANNGFATTFTPKAIALALSWVNDNSERLNVSAVLIAMGRSSGGACQIEKPLQDLIISLNNKGVQVVSATGNLAGKSVDYPACIPQVVAVGATDTEYKLKGYGVIQPVSYYTNMGPEIDFFMLGRYKTTALNGTSAVTDGTSNAAAAFAGLWSSLSGVSLDSLKATAGTSMRGLTPLPNTFLN